MAPKIDPVAVFDGALRLATGGNSSSGERITKSEMKKALELLDMSGETLTDADLKNASIVLGNYSKLLSKGANELAFKRLKASSGLVIRRVINGPSQSKMLIEAPQDELKNKFSVMSGVWIVRPENDLRGIQNFTNGTFWSATSAIDRTLKDPYAGHGDVGRFENITFDEFKKTLIGYMEGDIHEAGDSMTKGKLTKLFDGLATLGDLNKLEYYIAGWDVESGMGLGDIFLIYNREKNIFLATSKCTYAE